MSCTFEQVERYWDDWLTHRYTGHRNSAGAFEPSISYLEAMQAIPDEELRVFQELDDVYARMERQYLKQTKGNKNG